MILKFFALLYRFGTGLRNRLYDRGTLSQYRSKLTVISVGNISVGGNGKTPYVQHLAQRYLREGRRVAILLRGYGGSEIGPYQVLGSEEASRVGDEALLHKAELGGKCPVIVARSRVAGAKYIEDADLGDLIILDDGLQHRSLARDENLVLLDISASDRGESILSEKILPAGKLREDFDLALTRATKLVFVRRVLSHQAEPLPEWIGRHEILAAKPCSQFLLYPDVFVDLVSRERFALDYFVDKEVVALTAIAKPEFFFGMLQGLGLSTKRKIALADHSQFPVNLLEELNAQELPVIVTAKDAVKLGSGTFDKHKFFTLTLAASEYADQI
ncbi:tetraacyldisaccharide 4'-kinase [bacterium]|nr:tetraacyldisaccharide 4'-kinase [bacterium]